MEYKIFEIDNNTLYVIPCSSKLSDVSFRISKREWAIRQRKNKLKTINKLNYELYNM